MTGRYAAQTSVTVEKTIGEIERLLTRYGAEGFSRAVMPDRAMVAFRLEGRAIRFTVPLPDRDDPLFTTYRQGFSTRNRTESAARERWELACRQRWRALALVLQAKLEAIAAGISTVEDEWLSATVMPDGETFGAWARPQVERALREGTMPPLLALPSGRG